MKLTIHYSIRLFACLIIACPLFGQSQSNPLFSKLDPHHTNIHFNNALKDTKAYNIMIYSNYYGGAGVGIGDINNDGLPDIYFAGNLAGDQLYLNKGNFVFEEITQKAGIITDSVWASGVIFGDVNKDGWVDIYVTGELYDDHPEWRRNKLYINQKNNTFKELAAQYGVADTARTRHATFLDYDKDGDLDLFLLNQPPNPGDYSKFKRDELIQDQYRPTLYENQGERFVDVTEKAGLAKTGFPNSVTASDLNGDGWTDLFVANDFWIGDWYYINNGDGTFTDKIQEYVRHTSFSSMGVDAGDINNDGQLDLIVVDMVAEDNYRLKSNMSGMNPKAFWKVVDDGGHYQYMFNMLHLNIGEGQFSDIAQMANVASTDWSWSALLADLDNDGWKDLFITNGLMRDIRNNDASKKFPKYLENALFEYLQKNPNPGDISIWDIVDIEEALSIVPSEKLHNYVFKNDGDLTFSKKVEEWGFEDKTFSNGAAYADLDNDGDLDLVINNINDKASIYQNHSVERQQGNFLRIEPVADGKKVVAMGTKIWIETEAGSQFHEITGVRGMYSTSEMIAHFGLGQLSEVQKLKVLWPDGKEYVQEGSIKANQTIQVLYSQSNGQEISTPAQSHPIFTEVTEELGIHHSHQENEFDDYLIQVLMPHKMSTLGPALVAGDVNGDDLEDFLVGGAANEAASLFLQNKDGSFAKKEVPIFLKDKIQEDVSALFFDLENDGDLDLYVVSGGNEFNPQSDKYQDRLYLNDGQGNFSEGQHLLPKFITSGSKVYPEDFDQDGDIDLFVAGRHIPWAYPEPASSYLLLNEGGSFKNATPELAPELEAIGMVNDASWFDYDNDGWKDLVLVGEWMPITILKNKGKGFEKIKSHKTLDNTVGWWFSVATADMDNDGDEDIIAGNLGLNYKYKASEKEPFEVYYYDFDENGNKDVVLTYYNFGTKFPLRGRQCSSEQVPDLEKKFPTYDLFANADVFQVYGSDNMENALHYSATTFATTYFENTGDGQFKSHPLPAEAQLSSINDIVINDFNGDEHPDILMAGNLYNAEVETARNDAGYGLLLVGDGTGKFSPMPREKSGFFVPFNVKNITKLKRLNDQLFLVACNKERLRAFQFITRHTN